MMRIIRGDDAQREGAVDLGQRAAQRLDQIAVVVRFDQVRQHLGVGLAAEHVSLRQQLRPQRRVVLDDAVMDDGDAPAAIHVRVRVGVRGAAVGRPAGMPDAGRAVQRLAVPQPGGEVGKLAFGLGTRQAAIGVDDRDPG